ncbi:MFS transporter [Sphingomonas sp. AOB5]|uniref:MFS transporter n=1 Tax=Sphingomonas sp. AOB5 TaxID=3034017 RepID=UPI0023F856D6|nr:MFS transporter [Sphingomonas sp. AOB5]MDF7774852.1 MFS transporter [Sphingomonas sp. AOB5]
MSYRTSEARAWYVVAVLSMLSIVSYMDRLALGLLVQPIKADLGITDTQIGLLMGPAFALVYAGAALPIAFAIDRSNRKWIIISGVVVWSLATLLSAFATNFTTLFLLRMGVGVGEAVLAPAAVSIIGDLFVRERRPTPMATMIAAQAGGASASFLLVAALLGLAARGALPLPEAIASLPVWRVMLFTIGLPGLVLAVLMALTVSEPKRGGTSEPAGEKPADAAPGDAESMFRSRTSERRFYIAFILGNNLISLILFMMAAWFPTYLIRTFGETAQRVGTIFGACTIVGGIVGSLLVPVVAERFARRGYRDMTLRLAIAFVPLTMITALIATNLSGFTATVLMLALFWIISNSIGALPSVIVTSLARANERARIYAAHMLVQSILAASAGPFLAGYLSDRYFDGDLGKAMTAIIIVACPLSFIALIAAFKPYREAVNGVAAPAATAAATA